MKFKKLSVILLFVFVLLHSTWVNGQSIQENFTLPQKKTSSHTWKRFVTPNFNIYYYDSGKNLARLTAEVVEKEYFRLADLLGFYSFEKINLFIYSSSFHLNDLNIGKGYQISFSGGNTRYVDPSYTLTYSGSMNEFKKEISYKISLCLIDQILYGRGVKQMIRQSDFQKYPTWFTTGLAHYLANGWSYEMDSYVRNKKLNTELRKMNLLQGREAELTGSSLWNFITEFYGPTNVSNIIMMLQATEDLNTAFSITLNKRFNDVLDDWGRFYESSNRGIDKNIFSNKLFSSNKLKAYKVSPDGNKLATLKSKNGKYKIGIFDINSLDLIDEYSFGNKVLKDYYRYDPVLSWKNEEELTVVTYSHKGVPELHSLSKKNKTVSLRKLDAIQSLTFSNDGEELLISGSVNGQSDLFIFIPRTNKFYRLTNDIYDDREAVFMSGTKILFSSNRIGNTKKDAHLRDITGNFDLFLLDLERRENKISPLTSDIDAEYGIQKVNDSTVLYISNESGIGEIYSLNIHSKKSNMVFKSENDIEQVDLSGEKYTVKPRHGYSIYELNVSESGSTLSPVGDITKRRNTLMSRVGSSNTTFVQDTSYSNQWLNLLIDSTKFKSRSVSVKKRISTKSVTTSLRIDPLYGGGLYNEIVLSDQFENHRMIGSLFALSDFASSIASMEYQNKKGNVDYSVRYKRFNIHYVGSESNKKYSQNLLELELNLPISNTIGFNITPRVFSASKEEIEVFSINVDASKTLFTGVNAELVYKNVRKVLPDGFQGRQGKVWLMVNNGFSINDTTLNPTDRNFAIAGFDFREYIKVYKDIVWANRFSGGTSFGNEDKKFIFGGMNNWFFPTYVDNEVNEEDYASNFFYKQYATGMRGFGFNTRNGNSYLMLNSELRFPLRRIWGDYGTRAEIFNHMLLTIFTDFGSAWTGPNPFSTDNSFNKYTVGGNGNAFTIDVLNYRNPFVASFGAGISTKLYNTTFKADLGWGLEDYQLRAPMLMITLGSGF